VRQLGVGSFGVAHKVERRADGGVFVCKEIALKGMKEGARAAAGEEVALLRRVSAGSRFIVGYVDSFLENGSLHIIMEFCEQGDLSGYLKKQRGKSLEEPTVWKFLIQVGLALQWLHSNQILHRDIKAMNVFLTATGDARLGDLGVARVLSGSAYANTLVGTPYYLSPEMCEGRPYNDKSDVWAFGCVAYEMCALRRPFDAANQAALYVQIVRGSPCPLPDGYSEGLRGLVGACLARSQGKRPTCAEVLREDSLRDRAEELDLLAEVKEATEGPADPAKERARERWKKASAQLSQLHGEAVRSLDAPARLAWDGLYRLFRAKMASDLSAEDHGEIERHIFEDLPPENTDMISKICQILPLQQECDRCMECLNGG